MSASPVDPEQMQPAIKDGLIASLVAGLSMTARILLSAEPVSFFWVLRRIISASIIGPIVGYCIQDHITSNGLKMACISIVGYSAPECLDFLLRWVKAKGEKEVAKVQGVKKRNGKKRKAK